MGAHEGGKAKRRGGEDRGWETNGVDSESVISWKSDIARYHGFVSDS